MANNNIKAKIRRLLSFNQHKRRFGAKTILNNFTGKSLEQLKNNTIKATEFQYIHKAKKDITEHIQDLTKEFTGQAELLHYHASLIVMIRREYKIKTNLAYFEELWEQEQEFLLKNLTTRWLISAADTFADYAKDKLVRTLCLNASILINTIKISETERFLETCEKTTYNKDKFDTLQQQRVPLFDGTSAFKIGTDDTLRNLRWRIDEITKLHPSGNLLLEVFDRIQSEETVFKRFKNLHTREKTSWWK